MFDMLDKMLIGAKYRLHNFVEDFKHEEKGAAEIVAIILVIVVVIAVVVVFRNRIMDLVKTTFDDAEKVKDTTFLEIGNMKTFL